MTGSERTVLCGKYRIRELLGEGGMAVVHAAVNLSTERPVAIKRLRQAFAADAGMVQRFEREARAAGRIQSPHVVAILDIDRDEDGVPFIVMERLAGESLDARLTRAKRLSIAELAPIMRQLLAGIGAAHAAGVIHRDLKPGNVFLEKLHDQSGQGERVKILDFGISKIRGDGVKDETETGYALGTFSHMAPEQIRKTPPTPLSDLWALGVVVFRALTGRNPFDADDPLAMLAAILEQQAPPLCDLVPDERAARAFQPFVDGALAKRLGDRYASAEAMRTALEKAIVAYHDPSEDGAASGASRGRSRGPALVPAALALVAAASAGAWLGHDRAANAASAPAGVSLSVDPPNAEVLVDGSPVDPAHLPAGAVTARVQAPGFDARDVALPAAGAVLVRLAPSPPAPAAAAIELSDEPAAIELPADRTGLPAAAPPRGQAPRAAGARSSSKSTVPRAIARPPY